MLQNGFLFPLALFLWLIWVLSNAIAGIRNVYFCGFLKGPYANIIEEKLRGQSSRANYIDR
jgi:hypothetical protein